MFANSAPVLDFLAEAGIVKGGVRWRWFPGSQGGVFTPHRALNARVAADALSFPDGRQPCCDENRKWCQCIVSVVFRDSRGRFQR